ncbi:hypothetical protein [Methanobacterium sp.]|uniref:hypothetical protein n=1 Tax=Methanobacterium sp. TaxID=2164 RepID=UPI003C76B3AB
MIKDNDNEIFSNKTCPDSLDITENSTTSTGYDKTLLYIEDQFFDIEITKNKFIAYEKKNSGTKRTGRVKEYNIDVMENIHFEYPVTIVNFDYQGKKAVYSFNPKNYNALKDLMMKMGLYDPKKDVIGEPIDRNAALKEFINKIVSYLKRIR